MHLEYILCRVAVYSCVCNLIQHTLEYGPLTVAVHLYVFVCVWLSTSQHIVDDGLHTVAVHSSVCQLAQHNAVWNMVHTQLQSSLCEYVCVWMSLHCTWLQSCGCWILLGLILNQSLIHLNAFFMFILLLVNILLCFPHLSSISFAYMLSCLYCFVTLSVVWNMKCLTRGWFSCYHQADLLSVKCSSLFCPDDRQFLEVNKIRSPIKSLQNHTYQGDSNHNEDLCIHLLQELIYIYIYIYTVNFAIVSRFFNHLLYHQKMWTC